MFQLIPIFIHHDGALGDVILSLPSIHRIKTEGSVHFAGRADIAGLLKETHIVDDVSSSSAAIYSSLYAGMLPETAREFLQRFSRAFIFTINPDSSLVMSIRSLIPDTRVVETVPKEGLVISAARFRLDQIAKDADTGRGPFISIPPLYRSLADGLLSRSGHDGCTPIVAIHPGSGSMAKRWPLKNYLELASRIMADGDAFILIFSGPAEDGLFQEEVDAFARGRLGVVHFAWPELIALAALIDRSSLFIGNDSGVSHLAAALGRPVLTLFGPTDHRIWAPVGLKTEVIRADSIFDLDVETVLDRARLMLAGS